MLSYRILLAALLALFLGTHAATWAQPAKAGTSRRAAPPPDAAAEGFVVEPVPAWVKPVSAEPAPAGAASALYYLALDRQTRLGAGPELRFERRVLQVLQSAGLETASQVQIDFDPSYQTLVLHRIEIQRGAQRLDRLDRTKVRLLRRETRLEQQMVDGRLTASLVLDDLRVGDRVEYAYSLRGANPVFGGLFVDEDWMLAWKAPAVLAQYRLLAPVSRSIRHRIGDGAVEVESRVLGSERETLFRRRALPQSVSEPGTPPQAYLDDLLQLSEFRDWAAVAQWAQALWGGDASPMPQVRALAAGIAAASADPQERLRRALDFVQREVRYFGTEMGTSSHRPAAPETVLTQRHGDCKDKTGLLVALLRELGVPAVPVLVSTLATTRLERQLPSPLAFDHVIARITLPDGGVAWLDGTRAFQSGPVAERQATLLGWGLPAAADVTSLVALPSGADTLRLQAEDRLIVGAFVDEPELLARISFHGPLAERMRQLVAEASADELGQWLLGEYARVYAGARLKEPLRIEADDGHNRMHVTLRLALAAYWRFPEQRQLVGDVGFPLLMQVLRLPSQAPRRETLQLVDPGIYRHSVVMEFDEAVSDKESSARFEDGTAWFRLQVSTSNGPRRARLEAELRQLDNLLPPAQWPAYRDKLLQLWPRLSDSYATSAMRAEQAVAVRAALRELQEAVRRGQLRFATERQAQMRARVLMLDAELAGGRLSPRLRAQALMARGYDLDHLGRAEAARGDFEEVLRLRPDDAEVHAALAVNAMARGQDEAAARLAARALELAPTDAGARATLARARYELHDYAGARQALQPLLAQPAGLEHDYARLWHYLALRHGAPGEPAAAPAAAAGAWPQPVLQALTGETTAEQALAAARDGQADAGRLCELFFFMGELALIDGDIRRARELFQRSVDTGVVEFVEHQLSRRRLASLPR
jgi:lipoprotein NlpI